MYCNALQRKWFGVAIRQMKKIIDQFKSLISGGIFWIFGGSIVAQLCGMISSIAVIRFLPKEDYGCYVSANNFYSYFAVFVGLGLSSAILQFCSERRTDENKNAIYRFSFLSGELFNIVLGVLIIGFAYVYALSNGWEAVRYLVYMSGLPLVTYVMTYLQTFLRIKRMNAQYGAVNMVYSVSIVIGKIVLTKWCGVAGLIYSTYIASIITIAACLVPISKENFLQILIQKKATIPWSEKRELLIYSTLCAVTNFASSVLLLLDITCLNLVLRDNAVLADYHVASVFPSACSFIPSCLILYFYPIIVEKYQDGIKGFRRYFAKLVGVFSVTGCSVAIMLFIFTPLILHIFYGEKYESCSTIMRVLCLNFMISASFRRLFGNVIAAFKKVKINLLHNVIAGALNIALDLIFIQKMGSMGAALATTIVTVFITILETVYILGFLKKEEIKRG